MDTPTTVPELRRLLDEEARAHADFMVISPILPHGFTAEHWETRQRLHQKWKRARSELFDVLDTDATLVAMFTALEAAQDGCATCIEAMDPYSDTSLEACERIRGCTHARTRAALAPLFPKEDDDE